MLRKLEKELKKRYRYPYKWYLKQNDLWDSYTNFIYSEKDFDSVIRRIQITSENLNLPFDAVFQYATIRWYNFWSAQAVEYIFNALEDVVPVKEAKDREKDFYLSGIPFDHKTSVFPKKFGRNFDYARANKLELILWLYKNQSVQQRYHLKNRLFVVVYDQNGVHWKLKAELMLIAMAIKTYVAEFRPEQLHSFSIGERKFLSDIIWVNTDL